MKNRAHLLLFFLLGILGLQPRLFHAMDSSNSSSTVNPCREQQLIDAMKSDQSSEDIVRRFFAKPPLGLFDGTENINYQDADGNTPLMVAVICNRVEIVEKIIQNYNPKLSPRGPDGKMAKSLAFKHNAMKPARLLDQYEKDLLKRADTLYAKAQNDITQFQELINCLDLVEFPPVRYQQYTQKAFRDCNDLLLEKFTNILHSTVEEKIIHLLFIELCVINNDLHDLDSDIHKRKIKLFDKIISHYKRFIHHKNKQGNTLLAQAVLDDCVESTEILLKHGANSQDTITTPNSDGTTTTSTVLFHAAHNRQIKILKALIKAGADINAQDSNGDTVLALAIMKNPASDYIAALVGVNNIDLEIKNKQGKSAIDIFLEKFNKANEKYIDNLHILFAKNNLTYVSNKPYDQQNGAIRAMCAALRENSTNLDSTKALFKKIVELDRLQDDIYTHPYLDSIDILMPILQDPQHPHHLFACECTAAMLGKIKEGLYALEDSIYRDKNIGLLKAFLQYRTNDTLKENQYRQTLTSTKVVLIPDSILHCMEQDQDDDLDDDLFDMLIQCITSNFPAGVKIVCEQGLDPNSRLIEGFEFDKSPLILAITLGHVECVQELLNHGCNPNPPITTITLDKNGKEQTDTTPGDSIALARKHCPGAIALLENAQQTTISALPHDILRNIFTFIPPLSTSIKDRFESIGNIAQTAQNMYHSVSLWNNNNPKHNTWLLSIQQLSDAQKKEILQANLKAQKYDFCCTLLKHNPQLVVPTPQETPLLIQLITQEPLPPFELFEAVINGIKTINQTRVAAGEQPIELNAKSNFNSAVFQPGILVIFQTDAMYTKPEYQLTVMDIALCWLTNHIDRKNIGTSRGATSIDTLQKILTLFRSNGKTLTPKIVADRDNTQATPAPLDWLTISMYLNVDAWLLTFLLDEPSVDINAEIHCLGNNHRWTIFSRAVNSGDANSIHMLLKHPKIIVNKIDSNKMTALDYLDFIYDQRSSIQIPEILLNAGAKTAIELAIQQKDLTLFNACLQKPRFKNRMQEGLYIIPQLTTVPTVLGLCIDANFMDGIQALIDAGHNLNYADSNKDTPLLYALKHKKRDCALLLIDGGAEVNCWDTDGNSPLYWAIKHGYSDCATLLLNSKCNPGDETIVALAKTNCPTLVERLENAQKTSIHHLSPELINKIISHVPATPEFNKRFNIVGTVAECCKAIHAGATNLFRDPKAPASQPTNPWNMKLSKADIAIAELSYQEQEILLWEALNSKRLKKFQALLTVNPQLVNSRYPDAGDNVLVAVISRAAYSSITLLLDTIQCIVDTDKFVNKKVTLINQKSNYAVWSGNSGSMFYLKINANAEDRDKGLSAMDMLLLRLSLEDRWKQCCQYCIEQGGYFNTTLLCTIPGSLSNNLETTIHPTLNIILMKSINNTDTLEALKLFLKASPTLDINIPIFPEDQNSPALCWAAAIPHQNIIELLLSHPQIDVNTTNNNGQTALDLAYLRRQTANTEKAAICIALLESKGAKTAQELKPNARDNNNPQRAPHNPPAIGAQQPNQLLGAPAPAPVPGNNPPVLQHHWYKKPSVYWFAALTACGACIYGMYHWLYPADRQDDTDDNDEQYDTSTEHIKYA